MKPSIPKGTRDFGPIEMAKRNYIFNTIREVYALYGFQQIETPAQETLQTLMGKYGEEGDKLLFKILNSGDFLSKLSEEDLRVHPCPSVPKKTKKKEASWGCLGGNFRCDLRSKSLTLGH